MAKKIFPILIFCEMILSGCMFIPVKPARVIGSGNVISEPRTVSGITSISVEGSANVKVIFGVAESLVITGEDNIIFLIETNVQNHQLIVKTKPLMTYSAKKPVLVTVTLKSLKSASIKGSGNMDISGYPGGSLEVNLPGSGNISLGGLANDVRINLDGYGNIFADQLIAKTATVALNGSGTVTVYASERLDANIGGSGTIQYSGNPAIVNQKVTGSGIIEE